MILPRFFKVFMEFFSNMQFYWKSHLLLCRKSKACTCNKNSYFRVKKTIKYKKQLLSLQIGSLTGILKLKYQENKHNSYPSSTCQSALSVHYIVYLPCVLFFVLLSVEVFLFIVLCPMNGLSKLCEVTVFPVSIICFFRSYHCKVPCVNSFFSVCGL